jgi:hypothetical protein
MFERTVSSKGVCPCRSTPIFESVAATGDRPEHALLSLLFAEPRTLPLRIRNHFATCGSKTIVVQVEHGKVPVVHEEGHDRVDAASAEGVVGKVELVEQGVRCKGVAEHTERKWDLVDEPAGQHVGKVSDLCWQGRFVELLHSMNDEI